MKASAHARGTCMRGEHKGRGFVGHLALHLAPPSAKGSPRSRLKPLGQPGTKANGGVNPRFAVASWQGGGLGRLFTWHRACTSDAPHRKSIAVGCAVKA